MRTSYCRRIAGLAGCTTGDHSVDDVRPGIPSAAARAARPWIGPLRVGLDGGVVYTWHSGEVMQWCDRDRLW